MRCWEQLTLRESPVTEEKRTLGNLPHREELGEYVVQVPRATGHIEHRILLVAICTSLERTIECSDAGKRQSCSCVRQEYGAEERSRVGRARLNHRVIEVADDAEPSRRWRDEYSTDDRGGWVYWMP